MEWGEPFPQWRRAQKQHQCAGEGCAKIISRGDRYLDRTLREPKHAHLRYCETCAEPVLERANGYYFFHGRNDFPDRYQDRIASPEWKDLKSIVIERRGSRCQRCGKENISLELHHLNYRSLGNESLEDLELLCRECHLAADEERAKKR